MCDTTGLIDIAFQCYSGYSHLQQGWGYSVHSGERWRHVWGSHPPDCSADHGTYSRQAVVTCMCLWRRMKCIDYWNGSHRDRQPHHSGGVLGLLRLHETLVMGFPCFVRCTISVLLYFRRILFFDLCFVQTQQERRTSIREQQGHSTKEY